MRSDRVVVLPPFLDDDLCFLQAVEDFAVQQLIAQFCCDIPASRQATGVGLPCAIDTSIWRSRDHDLLRAKPLLRYDQAPLKAKLQEVKGELRGRMHQPIPEQGEWLRQVVTGFFAYHAVPTNFLAL